MKYLFSIIVAIGSVVTLSASAKPVWLCAYKPKGQEINAVTHEFVETSSKLLSAYDEDLTGKPNLFEIIENSVDGLIAISHRSELSTPNTTSSMRLVVIIINKKTGEFKQTGYIVPNNYEETYVGKCELKGRK